MSETTKHAVKSWEAHQLCPDHTAMGLQSPEWNDTGARVSPVGGGGNVAHVYSRAGYEPGTVETYARLIAAAPDLLEACELVVEHFNKTDATHDCTGRRVVSTGVADAVRTALAKATKGT